MKYTFAQALPILERTPSLLRHLLYDLPEAWTHPNEGPDTFSPFDVVGHLIHGEKTDWMARLHIILSDSGNKTFTPYDRFAHFEESKGKSMNELIVTFETLRKNNLVLLKQLNLNDSDLDKTGNHPTLGTVTLRNLLATWTVHDLSHLAQINRVMCKQYKSEVGPWVEYLPILKR